MGNCTLRISTLAFSVLALCLLLPAAASAAPVIVNGSFEAVQIGSPFVSSQTLLIYPAGPIREALETGFFGQ